MLSDHNRLSALPCKALPLPSTTGTLFFLGHALVQGHIVKGSKKPAAFAAAPPVWQATPARWPEPNPTIKGMPAATMGYKVGG